MEIKVGYSLEFIDTGKNSEENTGRTDSKNNSKKKKMIPQSTAKHILI